VTTTRKSRRSSWVNRRPIPANSSRVSWSAIMLLAVLTGSGEGIKAALCTLLRSLIEEGRRFAGTPDGQRWAKILANSPAIDRGWLLWNHANIDLLLRHAAVLPESPAALLKAALQQLEEIDMAKLMSELSRMMVELDTADPAGAPTRS
jgi:hypothetical protein